MEKTHLVDSNGVGRELGRIIGDEEVEARVETAFRLDTGIVERRLSGYMGRISPRSMVSRPNKLTSMVLLAELKSDDVLHRSLNEGRVKEELSGSTDNDFVLYDIRKRSRVATARVGSIRSCVCVAVPSDGYRHGLRLRVLGWLPMIG